MVKHVYKFLITNTLGKMVNIYVITYHHDDPSKCTALKMARLGYAIKVSNIRELPRRCLVLNPLSNAILMSTDKEVIEKYGIAVIDVSWNSGLHVLRGLMSNRYRYNHRALPLLFAGNPINYGKAAKLSSLEAVSAALYITGYKDLALRLLTIFKWGRTFYELNKELLDNYSKCSSLDEVLKIQDEMIKKILNN